MLKPYQKIVGDNDDIVEDGFLLQRDTIVKSGGVLEMTLTIRTSAKAKDPIAREVWVIDPKDSHDNPLQSIEKHWVKLRKEFAALIRLCGDYYDLKGGKEETRKLYMADVVSNLGTMLLMQPMSDKRAMRGKIDINDYPMVTLSERLGMMRNDGHLLQAEKPLPRDSFERALGKFARQVDKAGSLYDKAMYGGGEDGLQATAEDDSDADWRGDVHRPKSSGAGGGRRKLEPWEDDDFDPDDVIEKRSGNLMNRFEKKAAKFMDAANHVWMNAVYHVVGGITLAPDEKWLPIMKQRMQEAKTLYENIVDATENTGIGAYEMKAYYHKMESEVLPQMDKIFSLASRPNNLATEIAKALPRKREK